MFLKHLSVLEKKLIVAILVCAVLLFAIFQWFLKVKEEAENPVPAHVRQNSLLHNKNSNGSDEPDDIVEDPDEDPIQIFEKTKKTQRGLGNMLRTDIALPVNKPKEAKEVKAKAAESSSTKTKKVEKQEADDVLKNGSNSRAN